MKFVLDAPWCVHCTDLEKEWVKASHILNVEMPDVKLAKVDGSIHTQLVKDMNIRSYPGIIFTQDHGSRTLTYNGKKCMSLSSFGKGAVRFLQ